MASECKSLILKRGQIKGQLTRFINFVENYEQNRNVTELKFRLKKIEEIWNDFDKVQFLIEESVEESETDFEAQTEERKAFEDKYFQIISRAEELMQIQTENIRHNENVNAVASSMNLNFNSNLPAMNLPYFTGSYEGWLNFFEIFKALVHDNSKLSKIQKFYYLRSCLKGEAAEKLYSLEISEDNYDEAILLLKDRYENPEVLIHNHVKNIFDLPTLNKESHVLLRKLIDNFTKNIRALKTLGEPVDTWDTLLIHIISNKLDVQTQREWENHIKDIKKPNLADLLNFLRNKCQMLEKLDKKFYNKTSIAVKSCNEKQFAHVATNGEKKFVCEFCKLGSHFTYKCHKLLKLPTKSRYVELKSLGICTNCLRAGHSANECSRRHCQICNKRHNTILHDNDFQSNTSRSKNKFENKFKSENENRENGQRSTDITASNSQVSDTDINNDNPQVLHTTLSSRNHSADNRAQVLLATAEIYVLDSSKNLIKCRALLDSASQSNFMTLELFKRLTLNEILINMPITGINQSSCNISHKTKASIESTNQSFKTNLEFLIINNITGNIPNCSFDISQVNIPKNITLADSNFNVSDKIDILLGTEIFFKLLNNHQIHLNKNGLILQSTKLGWVLTGPITYTRISNYESKCFLLTDNTINNQLERFWEIENINKSHVKLSDEELDCEMHFRENFKIDATGRFSVKFPFKENVKDLGESLQIAEKRLQALEKKLSKHSELRQQYTDFLNEYEAMGHMTKIDTNQDSTEEIKNYLPHHAVIKESSSTSKVRVVFDASAKTTSGLSFNDVLKIGPKIQSDLFDLVIRMRTYKIVMIADIAKMYRMINIHETQRDFQRIIWRSESDEEISHFRLNTVTYGTSSASFLATRVLHQVGLDCKSEYPEISDIIINDFYMDDLITGTDSLEKAIEIKQRLETILSQSGFILRKWLSNDMRSIQSTDKMHRDIPHLIKDQQDTRTLGLLWNPQEDSYYYSLKTISNPEIITKRKILSNVAQIFDPLGLVNPCIVVAKLILQQLWLHKLDWDEPVPDSIKLAWSEFVQNIIDLNNIKISRCIIAPEAVNIQLHGFCDSSEAAYGACVYLRTEDIHGKINSNLLCAKSRLAPLKSISLPRLELCGALLLAQLVEKIKGILRIKISNVTYWTDSEIVLSWLKSEPNKWKVFVSNRVSEIQNLSEHEIWRHVQSKQNPADIISRGKSPNELKMTPMWWHGPSWIVKNQTYWPHNLILQIANIPDARKENVVLSFPVLNEFNIFSYCSTYNKLIRVMAYILRFIHNTRFKNKCIKNLTSNELEQATLKVCKIVQQEAFSKEIFLLKQSKPVHKNSKLLTLTPFLDSDQIIHVGGRLKNANLPFDQKYPIVLPSKHQFTKMLIIHTHRKYLHVGAQFILSQIRKQFWPLDGRNSIRSVLRSCVTCFRVKPSNITQLMGDLPEYRLTPTRPFTFCGVDYAGPYLMKDGKTRNRTFIKIYLVVFICLTTKSVHIELVTDLTSDGFMNAFKRFVSRRGLSKHIFSDNAKNFVGANNDLLKIQKTITNVSQSDSFRNYFLENKIVWHFIPPKSPHFGGMWESAIKSFKYHIKRVIGETKLNFEEFYTLVVQIEAILNSRPLIPLSSDPSDLQALTPGHFLIGMELTALPQESVMNINSSRLNHYQRLQQIVQNFWQRWRRDYLHTLVQRSKWKQNQNNIQVGTLVLIQEDNLPPTKWSLGRVVKVHPGADNLVRVVSVRSQNGVIKRSITKLCPLPIDDSY